jgi:uncharacterized membrane protein YeiH
MRLYIENTIFPGALGIAFIFGIRMLATKYRWKLPKIVLEERNHNK